MASVSETQCRTKYKNDLNFDTCKQLSMDRNLMWVPQYKPSDSVSGGSVRSRSRSRVGTRGRSTSRPKRKTTTKSKTAGSKKKVPQKRGRSKARKPVKK